MRNSLREMKSLNSFDMRDNTPKLAPGTVWQLRHHKSYRVRVMAIEGNLVRIKHLTEWRCRKDRMRPTVLNRYGFLQVYRPA